MRDLRSTQLRNYSSGIECVSGNVNHICAPLLYIKIFKFLCRFCLHQFIQHPFRNFNFLGLVFSSCDDLICQVHTINLFSSSDRSEAEIVKYSSASVPQFPLITVKAVSWP